MYFNLTKAQIKKAARKGTIQLTPENIRAVFRDAGKQPPAPEKAAPKPAPKKAAKASGFAALADLKKE